MTYLIIVLARPVRLAWLPSKIESLLFTSPTAAAAQRRLRRPSAVAPGTRDGRDAEPELLRPGGVKRQLRE